MELERQTHERQNRTLEAPTLKQSLDAFFRKYGLDSFGFCNWSVEINSFAFSGEQSDIPARVEEAVRLSSELAHGEKVKPETDIRSLISLKEIRLNEFAFDFLLVRMMASPCISDFEKITTQMCGARKTILAKEFKSAKVFDTQIPFGYCDGSIFALFLKETNEIVVVTVYGSD